MIHSSWNLGGFTDCRQLPSTEPTKAQLAQMERAYGMFIHFGVNTFGNVEWSDGGIDARSYQPDAIDADGWVKAAYDAGMNYVIMMVSVSGIPIPAGKMTPNCIPTKDSYTTCPLR